MVEIDFVNFDFCNQNLFDFWYEFIHSSFLRLCKADASQIKKQ